MLQDLRGTRGAPDALSRRVNRFAVNFRFAFALHAWAIGAFNVQGVHLISAQRFSYKWKVREETVLLLFLLFRALEHIWALELMKFLSL